MKAIKNYESFKKSLLSSTNGTMVESFDSSNIFGGCEYQSYRVYVDDVHYYNMFVIYNFATNTYDVSLETSNCVVSTMSRVVKTQKAMIESVCRWCYYSYLNTKEINIDSEEYTDRCEETENAECAKGNDVFEGCKTVKDVEKVCGDCSHFNACMQSNQTIASTCCMYDSLYKARKNPEWHHVSLSTLSKIDIDMLDEKRQRYSKIYKELIKTVNDLHKCKTAATYETRWLRFKHAIADDINYRGTTLYMTRFLDSKISMCNVECGLRYSADEKATSFIKSRRYRHTTLK